MQHSNSQAVEFDGVRIIEGVFISPVLEPHAGNPTGVYGIVHTPEGLMTCVVGDWIITNEQGERYPYCRARLLRLDSQLQNSRDRNERELERQQLLLERQQLLLERQQLLLEALQAELKQQDQQNATVHAALDKAAFMAGDNRQHVSALLAILDEIGGFMPAPHQETIRAARKALAGG